MDIIVTYGTFSIIFILVTTDVAVSVCGRSGLWPFRFVAVSVCGRSGLWPFRFVAVSVCGRSGLWPFRFVAVSVCGRFGCGRFGLWPLWPVTLPQTMTCVSRTTSITYVKSCQSKSIEHCRVATHLISRTVNITETKQSAAKPMNYYGNTRDILTCICNYNRRTHLTVKYLI